MTLRQRSLKKISLRVRNKIDCLNTQKHSSFNVGFGNSYLTCLCSMDVVSIKKMFKPFKYFKGNNL